MTAARDHAQRTVDATFREHGVPARYEPPQDTAVNLTVVISDEDRNLQFSGTSRPTAEGGRFEMRKSEIAAPVSAGIIVLLDDDQVEMSRHRIVGDPTTDDPFRLVWLCTVRLIA